MFVQFIYFDVNSKFSILMVTITSRLGDKAVILVAMGCCHYLIAGLSLLSYGCN